MEATELNENRPHTTAYVYYAVFQNSESPIFATLETKKAKVISFTHLPLVKYFLGELSGKSMEEVERTLCAQRKGHITKVIVSPCFSLIYNFRKGELTVSYNYG